MASLLYLFSAVLFIFSLKGLSSPKTSRLGNTLGMIGMAVAILTTFNIGHNLIVPTYYHDSDNTLSHQYEGAQCFYQKYLRQLM